MPIVSRCAGIVAALALLALFAPSAVARGNAEAYVLSGTGMPTLQALRVLRGQLPIPVVSSNLCLAWALLQTSAPNLAPSQPQDLLAA